MKLNLQGCKTESREWFQKCLDKKRKIKNITVIKVNGNVFRKGFLNLISKILFHQIYVLWNVRNKICKKRN